MPQEARRLLNLNFFLILSLTHGFTTVLIPCLFELLSVRYK